MINNDNKKTFTAEIIDTALPNGWGVAKHEGMIYFLPNGAVGDTVTVREIKKTKSFSYGEITETIKESQDRTKPLCPHAEKCSGCIFQNLNYDKQLEIKHKHVLNSLSKFAGVTQPELNNTTIHKAEEKFYYRNKIELSVNLENNQVIIGYKERLYPAEKFTDKITPVDSCVIFSKATGKIISVIKQWIETNSEELLNEKNKRLTLSKIGIKESKSNAGILIYLITGTTDFPNTEDLYNSLKDEISSLSGLAVLKRDYKSHKPDELIVSHGDSFITEQLDDLKFNIYPQTFFQPNTKMALKTYNLIAEKIVSTDRILGLYCGSGVMEIFLSRNAKRVTGIDVNKINIKTANENLKQNNIRNCAFKKRFAEDILRTNIKDKYDKIIIDPPRNGLTKHAAGIICRTEIPQIIYLSCSPPTLARDIKILKQHGYVIKSIDILDQFPQTAHVETLVWLKKE